MKKVMERKERPVLGGEAANRHDPENMIQELELDPNQSVPGKLLETEEPELHYQVVDFREPTKHSTP
ncbi:MAG TPA: hypothetical protein V6D00_14325 [Pantanalinema sp.]